MNWFYQDIHDPWSSPDLIGLPQSQNSFLKCYFICLFQIKWNEKDYKNFLNSLVDLLKNSFLQNEMKQLRNSKWKEMKMKNGTKMCFEWIQFCVNFAIYNTKFLQNMCTFWKKIRIRNFFNPCVKFRGVQTNLKNRILSNNEKRIL